MSAKSLTYKLLILMCLAFMSIVSKGQLVPQFTSNIASGCAPLVVSFQDQSTGTPNEWKWYVGTGTTYSLFSVLQNPSTTFFNPGTYNIRLVIKNAAGQEQTLTKTAFITVNASPTVNFTGTPLSGCFPLLVSFADNSVAGSGTIVSWNWDFGDGNGANTQNPQHTYTASGGYSVTLTVTNSAGCAKTITKSSYISVSSGVSAAFTNSIPSGCTAPETVTFQNQSTGAGTLSYLWNFGDGSPTSTQANPLHQYNTTGSFSVTLTVTSSTGCVQTITHPNAVVIGEVNAAFTLPATVCVGQTVSLVNTSNPTPTAASWNFGDGTFSTAINPTKIYTTAGTYTIQLTSTFGGCTDVENHDITIFAAPIAQFTGSPTSSCTAPLTVNFVSTSIDAISYLWLFGDGNSSTLQNPTHTYNNLGTYSDTLIVTNANGCIDTLIRTDYINVQPPAAVINGLPRQGCAPITHQFNATVSSVDAIVSYQWFSNGTLFSNLPNPTQTFTVGDYNIQLVITTAGGCTDTVIVPNGIRAALKPTANFVATPTVNCAFLPIAFQNLSTGNVTQFLWLFGDGSQSNQPNPTHQYTDTGTFSVTLIISNNGCTDTLTFLNYITITPPISIFDVGFNCNERYKRVFDDNSLGADIHEWNFGDGTTSTLANPTHIYAALGTYTVTLKVYNNATGCNHTSSQIVIIADEFAAFTASQTQFCKTSGTTFTATSPNSPPAIANYLWNFGDGVTQSGNPVSHTYLDANNYDVKLIITDVNGCRDSLTQLSLINVYGPTSNFNPTLPGTCLLSNISFTDLSTTDGTHPIIEWKWEYGDGVIETLTAPPFSHAYANAGIYSVTLTVKDTYGCSNTFVRANVLTVSQPMANFSTLNSPSCPNAPVTFVNASTGPSLTYVWNFGDGTPTSTATNPTHAYLTDGDYTVTLTITDQYGCTDAETKPSYVQIHTPNADFSVNQILSTCPPLNGQFTNLSTYASSYLWEFSAGNPAEGTSTLENPSHIYNNAGMYNAQLTVTGPGGCTDVKTQLIEVRGPTGTFNYTPLVGCNPLTVNFAGSTTDPVNFIWDYNDGVVTAASTTPTSTHIYTTPGFYLPKMILQDASGCTVPIVGLDTIKVNGVLAAFDRDTLLRCNNGEVVFTNNSFSNELITAYEWDFGDGSPLSNAQSPTHFYATVGLYYPKLKVTTQSNCTNQLTAATPVKVVKTPDITVTQSANSCEPATMSFNGNLINADTSAITWQWVINNGTANPIIGNAVNFNGILFQNAGQYVGNLYATNSSGCKDTSNINVDVFAKPIISAGNDITICQGTGQTLAGTGGVSYVWAPSTGLSCTNCISPTATPAVLQTYVVTGTSALGCQNTDSVVVAVQYPFNMPDGVNEQLCIGKSKVLTANGAITYEWSPSAGLSSTTNRVVTASPTVTTNYRVVGRDDKNCFTDTAFYFVKVFPIPTVNAGNTKKINVGQTVLITPTISADVNSVIWNPTTNIVANTYPSILVKPNVDTKYKVTVSNVGGCTAESFVDVIVTCDGTNVFIPNTFSPNGDGSNEIFYPRGTGLFSIKTFRIFNRWGEQVYERYGFKANDENAGWDGTFKGKKLMPDVYVYMMDVQCENNSVLVYKGNIALIN